MDMDRQQGGDGEDSSLFPRRQIVSFPSAADFFFHGGAGLLWIMARRKSNPKSDLESTLLNFNFFLSISSNLAMLLSYCCALIVLCAYPAAVRLLFVYPAVPLFYFHLPCCALIFLRAYPAVPLFFCALLLCLPCCVLIFLYA